MSKSIRCTVLVYDTLSSYIICYVIFFKLKPEVIKIEGNGLALNEISGVDYAFKSSLKYARESNEHSSAHGNLLVKKWRHACIYIYIFVYVY